MLTWSASKHTQWQDHEFQPGMGDIGRPCLKTQNKTIQSLLDLENETGGQMVKARLFLNFQPLKGSKKSKK
jgi:hypothetical protein